MFAYWAMMLSVTGMYSLYIIKAGFTKTEIGLTVTLFTISTLTGQNVLGYLCDRYGHIKGVLFLAISSGILTGSGLALAGKNWQIIVLIALWGFFIYGTVPLTEAFCIRILRFDNNQSSFGKVRGFGSLGYALSGIVFGLLIDKIGWKIYFWYILASVLITLVTIVFIKDCSAERSRIKLKAATEDEKGESKPIKFQVVLGQLSRNKPLKSIIIILFFYMFVVRGIYSYLGILMTDFGGGALSLGLAYMFDAGPEVATFFLTSKLMTRYQSKWLILVSFILQIIRLSFMLVFNNSLSIILLGSLSGFAFGLLAPSYKTFIYDIAPPEYKISLVSLSESIIGLSAVLSAPVFGLVIIIFGGQISIVMGLIINILVAVYLLWIIRTNRFQG